MAELEGEALLLGIWRNVDELEEMLTLPELEAIIKAAREQEKRNWKFQAGLKGMNLDLDGDNGGTMETAEEALDRIKRKAAARAQGLTENSEIDKRVEQSEIFDMGLDFIVEE